jgi:hypothetical protein
MMENKKMKTLTWRSTLIFDVFSMGCRDDTEGLRLSTTVFFGEPTNSQFIVVVCRSTSKGSLHQTGFRTLGSRCYIVQLDLLKAVQIGIHDSLKGPEPLDATHLLVLIPCDATVADFFKEVSGVGCTEVILSIVRVDGIGSTTELVVVQSKRETTTLLLTQIDTVTCQGLIRLLK